MATGRTAQMKDAVVVATFHSHTEAQQAVQSLLNAGFTEDQIGIAAHDPDGTYTDHTDGSKAGEGAALGATAGLGAGALWGLGIVAGALPAIGPVIAGGALAAVVASAAGTAVAGGLIGALLGLGIPEEEAQYYENEFKQGRTIVTVRTSGESAEEARRILDEYNAYDFGRRDSDYARDPYASERLDYQGNRVTRRDVM
jgi:hypothetical protein